MVHPVVHHAITHRPLTTLSYSQLFSDLSKLFEQGRLKSPMFLIPLHNIELFLLSAAVIFLCLIGYLFIKMLGFNVFRSAFEQMKFKKNDINAALATSVTLEITIPKNSQATAFQVQQKILKTLHSVYNDPIEGAHEFSPFWFFFQKLYRFWNIYRSPKVFFIMQIWGQYPNISFRLTIPSAYYDRMEKALYNAYPGCEITLINTPSLLQEIAHSPESFLSYGQSTIAGAFYHRIKSFRDFSSDPVDSLMGVMEALKEGQFMVYIITLSPSSHYFNQLIHYRLEEEERTQQGVFAKGQLLKQPDAQAPDLRSQLRTAMIEKMKASLFQVIISYWAVMPTEAESRAKLANIQSVLTQLNQKNMNTLKHTRLFTKPVKTLKASGELERIVGMQPILKRRQFRFVPFLCYQNHGQIVSDGELYALWHLPNLTPETVASVKVTRFKKLPASFEMRSFPKDFFVHLGSSNFKMHEQSRLGIPTWDDLKKHVYILGGTGAGKSETLKTILQSLLEKKGTEKTACLIIDPKNDFATDLLAMIPDHRKDDVIYFNPTKQKNQPLSFPFFSHFSGEKTNDERIEFLVSIMKRFVQIDSLYSWGPELENILRQLFATAYLLPVQSLSGLDQLLHEPGQIKNIVPFLPTRLQQFWLDSILKRTNNDLAKYLATTNNKVGKILDYPEFMNIADRLDTKITVEEMIQTGKIFIANLGACSEQMKKYYSVYLTAHIAEAIFGQARLSSSERKPAVFVVDEFQRVASDIFETLFSEVRAFNTALVISNQFMGQLDQKIQKSIESNIGTKIFMRTQSVDDAEIAQKILGGTITTQDIMNLPTGSAYIKTLVDGIPQEAMSMTVQRTERPSGSIQDIEAEFVERTMDRYGTSLPEITKERNAVNSLYYTPSQSAEFFKKMGQHRTEQAAGVTGLPVPIPESTALTPEN